MNLDPSGKFFDLNMLVQYGALERTGHQFQVLLKDGGFEVVEILPTRSALSIIVAWPLPAT